MTSSWIFRGSLSSSTTKGTRAMVITLLGNAYQ
jgi:hypothetical protein